MNSQTDHPRASDVRVFVPAKDFAMSQAFYQALGWTELWHGDGLALMELADHRFMLQDYYANEWAENFMIVVEVDSAADWHRHAADVLARGDYGKARVAEPKQEAWATVTYVWDPSGVLLHFSQFMSPDS